jgi:hypothetical protein
MQKNIENKMRQYKRPDVKRIQRKYHAFEGLKKGQ